MDTTKKIQNIYYWMKQKAHLQHCDFRHSCRYAWIKVLYISNSFWLLSIELYKKRGHFKVKI